MNRRAVLGIVGSAAIGTVGVSAAGCIDRDGDGTGADADADVPDLELRVDEEPADERTVRMTHHGGFTPDVTWVSVGGTVTWRNSDDADLHDTVSLANRIPADAEGWASELLSRGEQFSRTFPVEGIYDYVCTPHQSWMLASVIVGHPDPESQPALSAPSDRAGGPNPRVIRALNVRVEELLEES